MTSKAFQAEVVRITGLIQTHREEQTQENATLRGFIQRLQDRDRVLTNANEALQNQHMEAHRLANSAVHAATDANARMAAMETRLREEMRGARAGGGDRRPGGGLVDPKHMRPKNFGDQKESLEEWKAWSAKLVRFAGNVDPKFKESMMAAAAMKSSSDRIMPNDLGQGRYQISIEQDMELQSLLIDCCTGKAFALVTVWEKEQSTGLEMWRRLEEEYNGNEDDTTYRRC